MFTSSHTNRNLKQSINSLIQHISGLGTNLGTKQLQNPGHKQVLITFKSTNGRRNNIPLFRRPAGLSNIQQ